MDSYEIALHMQNAADSGNVKEFIRLHSTLKEPFNEFFEEAETMFGLKSTTNK